MIALSTSAPKSPLEIQPHIEIVTAGFTQPRDVEDYRRQWRAVEDLTTRKKRQDRCRIAQHLVGRDEFSDDRLDGLLTKADAHRIADETDSAQVTFIKAMELAFRRLAIIQLAQPVHEGLPTLASSMKNQFLIDKGEYDRLLGVSYRDLDDMRNNVIKYRDRYYPDVVDCISQVSAKGGGDMSGPGVFDGFASQPSMVRDGFRCVYCGIDLLGTFHLFSTATLDHFRPRSAGGSDETSNRVASCASCDRIKASAVFSDIDAAQAAFSGRREELRLLYRDVCEQVRDA